MAPQISPFKISEDLSEGRRLSLVCSVTLGTPPMSFTWLKDGKSLGDLPNVKLVHLDDFQDQLQIEKLSADHAGNYTCNAKNGYGSDRIAVQVVLKFAPKWKSNETVVQGVAGGTIRIDCASLGHPKPQLGMFRGEFN